MPFTPVAFSDYLKKFDDILSKKFKKITSNVFTVKSTDGQGLNIEGSIKDKYSKDFATPGSSLKVKFKKAGNTFEATTDSMSKCTASVENTTLAKGVTVKAEGQVIPAPLVDAKKDTYNFIGISADYVRDMFTGSVSIKKYKQPANVDAKVAAFEAIGAEIDISAGQDGISGGGTFATKFIDGKAGDADWGVGFNVAKGDFVVGAKTTKFDKAKYGFNYKVCPKTSVNVQVESVFKSFKNSSITVGAQRQFNKNTLLQAKVDNAVDKAGARASTVSTVVEYTIPDFSSKVQFASAFASKGNSFGVAVTYGDK